MVSLAVTARCGIEGRVDLSYDPASFGDFRDRSNVVTMFGCFGSPAMRRADRFIQPDKKRHRPTALGPNLKPAVRIRRRS